MQGSHLSIIHRFLLYSFLTLTPTCIFQNMCTSPEPYSRKGLSYRPYSRSAMTKAYYSITDNGMSIRGAAYKFGLPEATLRNRVSGKIGVEVIKSGKEPLINLEEENCLVQNIKVMASCGYGYSRSEVVDMASRLYRFF